MMKLYTAFCLTAFLASSAASRPPPPSEFPKYVCPVGGERFEQYGNLQHRLDQAGNRVVDPKAWLSMRHDLGELGFPECPTNGLPMYRDFTPDELKRLPALLQDRAFRALRKDTPQPMRAHWLATQLGESAEAKLYLIVPALDLARSSAMRKRALRKIVEAFEIAPFGASWESTFGADISTQGKIEFRLVYVHSLRELGLFERALTELKALPTNTLNGVVPIPILGPEESDGDDRWQPTVNRAEIEDRSRDKGLLEEIAKIEKVVLRRDATPNLIELLDDDVAAAECEWSKDYKLAPSNRSFCMTPLMVTKQKLRAEKREKFFRETQSGKAVVEDAARAVRCATAKSEQAQIDMMPSPLSPEGQSDRSRIAVELAACEAYDAM